MGCDSVVSSRPINEEIFVEKEEVGHEDFDELLANAFEKITEVELLRRKYAILSNDFEFYTGGIMLKNPTLTKCLYGLFWMLARHMSDISSSIFKLSEDYPFIILISNPNHSFECKQIINATTEYFNLFTTFERHKINNLFDDFFLLKQKYNNKVNKPKELFEKFDEEVYLSVPKLKNYIKAFEIAYDILFTIKETMLSNDIQLKNFAKVLEDKNEIEIMNKIGREAKVLKLDTSYEIVAKFSDDFRHKDIKTALKIRQFDERHKVKYQDQLNKSSSVEMNVLKKTSSKKKDLEKEIIISEGGKIDESARKDLMAEENDPEGSKIKEEENYLNEKKYDIEKILEEKLAKLDEILNKKKQLEEQLENLGSYNKYKMNNPVYLTKTLALKSWNLNFKKTILLDKNSKITSVLNLPDLDLLITGNNNGNITIWIISIYKPVYSKNIHKSDITSICYLNNDKTIFAGSADGRISKITFNIELNKFSYILSDKVDGSIIGLYSAIDGNLLCGVKNKIVYWEIERCSWIKDFEICDTINTITSLYYSIELKLLIVGLNDSKIKLFDPIDQTTILIAEDSHCLTPVMCLTTCYMDDLLVLSSTGEDNVLKIWNITDIKSTAAATPQKLLLKTEKFNGNIVKINYCNDYKSLFLVIQTGMFTLYDLTTGERKDFLNKKIPFTNGSYFGDGKNFLTVDTESSLDFYGSK